MDGIDGFLVGAGEAAVRAAALSRRAEDGADTARSIAARVQSTADTPWRSVAAGLFRQAVADLVVALRGAAADLDEAADLLRGHAAVAAARVEHLAALARVVDRAAVEGLDDVAQLAADALDRALPGPLRLP